MINSQEKRLLRLEGFVNVQDKALTIAVYFEHFYNALKSSGFK